MSRILAPLAVAIGILLFWWGPPIWWIGAGLVAGGTVAGALTLREPIARMWASLEGERALGRFTFRPQEFALEAVSLFVLMVVGSALTFPALTGDAPVSADHPVHMFRAWTMKEMVLDGRFYGWSHEWFAGYPAQYLYPIGADIWVNAIWLGTLGLASIYTVYSIAIWSMFCLQGVAVYLMSRRDIGRLGGVVAGLFVLGDDGAFRLGGWVFGMHWGVWPQNFGVVIGCLAVWKLRDVLLTDERLPIALFGFLMGASICTHPLLIIFWAAALPIAAFSAITSQDVTSKFLALARLFVGAVIGGLVAGFWLLPFVSSRDFSEGYGVAWQNSLGLAEGIYHGTIFAGTWSTVIILGGFVLLSWATARRVMPTFFATMGFALVIGGATDLIAGFHLLEVSDAFGFLQFTRFPILAKPFWFIGAAFGLVTLLRWSPSILAQLSPASDRNSEVEQQPKIGLIAMRVAVLGVFLAPLLFGWLDTTRADQFSRGLLEYSERNDAADRAAMAKFINEEAKSIDGIARVGIDFGHDEHSMHDWQMQLDVPLYKVGYTPAETFIYKMEGRQPALLAQTNTRWVVTRGRTLPMRAFEAVGEFGPYRVFRVKSWSPEPFTLNDSPAGSVKLESWSAERIVLNANDSAAGELILHVSHFDRWAAYRDGKPLEIRVTPNKAEPNRTGFMTVDLGPGTYEFVFEARTPEYVAWISLLLALVLIALFVVSLIPRGPGPVLAAGMGRIQRKVESLEGSWGERAPVVVGVALGAVLVGVIALAAWKPPLKFEFEEPAEDVVWDIANDLESASVGLEQNGRRRGCRQVLGRHYCGEATWQHVFATYAGFRDDEWRRCVWAHPQQGQTLALNFDDIGPGSRLVGYYGVAATGASRGVQPVDLRIARDATVVFEGATKRDRVLYPVDVSLEGSGEFDLKVEVSASNAGRRHFCFMLQVVE